MVSKNIIPNRREGEEIIYHLRRHWFIFFKIFLGYLGLFLIPPLIYLFFQQFMPALLGGEFTSPILLVLAFSYYLMMLVFVFTVWTERYLDVWTLTTDRIISREQIGLFNRVVSELEMYRVQDVTVEQKGFMSTILNFGDIYIQSAGEIERFEFKQIGNPYQVAKTIQKLNEASQKTHNITV